MDILIELCTYVSVNSLAEVWVSNSIYMYDYPSPSINHWKVPTISVQSIIYWVDVEGSLYTCVNIYVHL